ncbi:MAG: hypothetical protein KDA84_05595 [Planctomycetaceae bacterium]|nr:hypothetical protein [Planctomycetaceae bacterium]
MFSRSYLILLVLVFNGVGLCDDKSEISKPLIPFALGNSWTYEATRTDANGDKKRTFPITNRVVAARLFKQNGKWETWYHFRDFEMYYWVKDKAPGLVEGYVDFHLEDFKEEIKDGETWDTLPTIEEEVPFLYYPCQVGKKWKLYDGEEGDPPTTMELFAKDVTIKCDAGTYPCLQYRMRYKEGFDDYYISPGVGIVKFTVEDDKEKTQYLLKSYQLQK